MAIKSRKVRFLLVVAALLTGGGGAGCSSATRTERDADVDLAADADAVDADVDADADAVDGDVDADADAWVDYCSQPWQNLAEFEVRSPEEGAEPTQSDLCAAAEPVLSPRAGRVTLTLYSASLDRAAGQVQVPEELRALVTGLPTFEVVEADPPTLSSITISEVAANEQGFGFIIDWAEPPVFGPSWYTPTFGLEVSFGVRCDEAGTVTREVRALTYLNLCYDTMGRRPAWESSGDQCWVCEEMCEMAPSPIVPRAVADGSALPRALRLEIVPVARAGRALCLVAEHDGAIGEVRYSWQASAGELSEDDQGGVIWEPPLAEPALIQVALRDRDSAAVASLRWPARA